MKIVIPGYKITEEIQLGLNTVIYRGIKQLARTSVIIKALQSEYPTLEEIARLRHEYKILQYLGNIEGVINPYSLENYKNGFALILEDFQGFSLNDFINTQRLGLDKFLKIAIKLADTLDKIHGKQIIHKDIKPHNIIINPETEQVKIIDFSIASRLYRENQFPSNTNLIEGTLAYISPEQTGRMNRSLDYRTDFYSLGITFYEMLVGNVPFNTTDPLELIHCHIAKAPVPPHQLDPKIPAAISEIIMKLLSKTAEDRYQSAYGLKADLDICLDRLLSNSNFSNFLPGHLDKSSQFLIPQKLYGRAAEVVQLLEAFERVSCGTSEMMLVSGYSGIGKSSLVAEVHKPIVRQRGYFISGKFDQFKRNIPYASLIQAFQELMRQLLTENKEKIAIWKEKILEAVGSNCQIVIDVIPEVELIVGSQPAVPVMGPSEAQNRFNRVFKEFIHVFTKAEHPLVLFLDDLQWADGASLNLIQVLMTDPDSQYLLTIGAYRDNEVSPTHPLMLTLEDIHSYGATVNNITLQPLDLANVSALVADILHDNTSLSMPLAELLFNKTQGNPFFLTQLLSTLHAEKLLTFNFSEGAWQWSMEQIQTVGITDYNVVELLARNIQKLPSLTQQVLKLAACMGDKFNLDVLAIVNEKSSSETASDLWEALQAGLILPLSETYKIPLVFDESSPMEMSGVLLKVSYKFLHDRVQQAAYSLIPDESKKETHLKIGKLLLKNTPENEIEDNIFEIVNQLNVGLEFITHQSEKEELIRLNWLAGRKAKAAMAYEPAIRYLTVGLGLLAEDSWQRQYDMTLQLYVEALEVEYLNTNFDRAAILAEMTLNQAQTLLDKVKVYELKILFEIAQNKMLKAIETGLSALEMLGCSLSEPKNDSGSWVELPRTEDLENIPAMTDPYKLAALRLLLVILTPVYIFKTSLLPSVILTIITLCIEHGHSAQAAYAYSFYGLLLCGSLDDIDSGYYSGQIALKLLEQFSAKEIKSKVYVLFNAGVRHWKEHIKESLAPFLESIKVGLEIGDLEFVGYSFMHYSICIFIKGENLELVESKQAQNVEFLLKIKQDFCIYYVKIWRQLVLNLLGRASNKYKLSGESFDEDIMLPYLHSVNNLISLFGVYLAKTILYYFFKDYERAVESAKLATEYLEGVPGQVTVGPHNFYYSLSLLAHYPYVESSLQKQYLYIVEENQKKMKQWAHHAPVNYQHKYALVEAEKARVLGQIFVAMEYYDLAIQGAKDFEYIQEEALANERAAEFYLSRGREKLAQVYLTEAYYGYIRWGAKAKVKDLEEQYPQLLQQISNREIPAIAGSQPSYTTVLGASALDLATVMKASQAISSEIVLDKLLEKLMQILLENAGAQKGNLILEKEGKLVLATEGNVEQNPSLVLPSFVPLDETSQNLPLAIINYVERTQKSVVLNDATREGMFSTDPYIINNQPKSLLCAPILHQGKLVGILYLENNLTIGAFTNDRLEVLRVLSGQAAISLELAQAVNKVQDTVAFLSAIINNIADGLLVTDAEGNIYQFNPALSAMYNLSGRELIGKGCKESFNSDMARLVAQTLESPMEVLTAEVNLAEGRIGKAVATAISKGSSFAEDSINESLGSVIVIRDITAEKEVDRMKTDFISTVSHELRTPLTSVLGFAKIIKKKLEDGVLPSLPSEDRKAQKTIKQVGENINIIISEGSRLTSLINDVLDIAKMEAGKVEWQMQAISIEEVIERAIATTSALFESNGLTLLRDIESGLPEVVADADRLLQVMINLISNAVKFTEKGSCTLRAKQHNNQIVVSVIDTGIGIAPGDRTKVFEKFKQVGEVMTDKPKGTGLGLPICKQIVEHHGGRIWVESEPSLGSTFSFTLPLVSSAGTELEKMDIDILVKQLKDRVVTVASSPTDRQKTILVVDDDAHIRELLKQELEAENYIVKQAKDGMEAITQVKEVKPDLIILDVMMPQINGFDVAAVLKNDPDTMSIPIVILSIVEDKERGYRLGIEQYFTKPINTEALLKEIGLLISNGTSKKKVLVVDEDASTVRILSDVLQAKGYSVVEASNGPECIEKALSVKPDMIIVDSLFSQQHNLVKTLRFDNGMENVFFLLLADGQVKSAEKKGEE